MYNSPFPSSETLTLKMFLVKISFKERGSRPSATSPGASCLKGG